MILRPSLFTRIQRLKNLKQHNSFIFQTKSYTDNYTIKQVFVQEEGYHSDPEYSHFVSFRSMVRIKEQDFHFPISSLF